MFIDFRGRLKEGGREGERERNIYVREKLIGCLPHAPWPGIEPAAAA